VDGIERDSTAELATDVILVNLALTRKRERLGKSAWLSEQTAISRALPATDSASARSRPRCGFGTDHLAGRALRRLQPDGRWR